MAAHIDIEPETAATPATPLKMTFEEFLDWADEDTWAEWVDGEVMTMSPVSREHQELVGFLLCLMRGFVEEHAAGMIFFLWISYESGPVFISKATGSLFHLQHQPCPYHANPS